jgi:hypothetical protein
MRFQATPYWQLPIAIRGRHLHGQLGAVTAQVYATLALGPRPRQAPQVWRQCHLP